MAFYPEKSVKQERISLVRREDTMKTQKQVIISIGREFGSAGHEIAERIAKR